MIPYTAIPMPVYHRSVPMIDGGFDRFESASELGEILRETARATICHTAPDTRE